MNTHLHILEAYTNLYRVWNDEGLAAAINRSINVFQTHIIDAKTAHLYLFFDENWVVKSDTISYGHDIEASWLLLEAAAIIGDENGIQEIKALAVDIARSSATGLAVDGSMFYESEPLYHQLITDKHWWVQAEAVIGFYNAYQITGEQHSFDKSDMAWRFIQQQIIDHQKGEWFWGITVDHKLMKGYDKAGFWKCPYHNSRACIEVIKRLPVFASELYEK